MKHYDRAGREISMMRWARLFEDRDYRFLGQYNVGNLCVSTIWLGLDHRFLGDGPPLIFESMIFEVPQGDEHWKALEMRRYETEHQAMVGHTDLVVVANTLIEIDEEVRCDTSGWLSDGAPSESGSE